MSNPTCTIASLNLACFKGHTLDLNTRKRIFVYLRACELKGIGWTDYVTNAALLTSPASGGLVGDANALFDSKSSDDDICKRDIGTFELAIAQNAAVAAGGTTALGIQARIQQVKCLLNVNDSMIERMLVFLECRLGVHKNYVQ